MQHDLHLAGSASKHGTSRSLDEPSALVLHHLLEHCVHRTMETRTSGSTNECQEWLGGRCSASAARDDQALDLQSSLAQPVRQCVLIFARVVNDHGIIIKVRANVLGGWAWVGEGHVVFAVIRGEEELVASLL